MVKELWLLEKIFGKYFTCINISWTPRLVNDRVLSHQRFSIQMSNSWVSRAWSFDVYMGRSSNHYGSSNILIFYMTYNHRQLYLESLLTIVIQPQRPVRSIRVYGDENVAPGIGLQKTIHQRNKSSPALSSMAQNGGLKAAAKRTAFGDLSNAVNVSRPSKDDSAILTKPNVIVSEKPVAFLPIEKKPVSLLRPAQRPLSVSGLKSLLHNVSGIHSQTSVKQAPIEPQQPVQQANTKKLATKKSTAVFKDTAISHPDAPKPDTDISRTVPLPPVHRELLPSQRARETKLPGNPQPNSILEEPQTAQAPEQPSSLVSSSEAAPFRSDGIYIDNHGDVQHYIFSEDNEDIENQRLEPTKADVPPAQSIDPKSLVQVDEYLRPQEDDSKADMAAQQKLPPILEPEEYWDEEDGNYDEEGYVTARSFKSRGDNTTNGVTTVVFPKVNQKIKKELAVAKELVETSKTPEEIDDETWDTSMVAEYGDEIFGYMRDLEVCGSLHGWRCTRLTMS